MGDAELLATVSPDWRMEGYKAIVEKFDTPAELRDYLTTDQSESSNGLHAATKSLFVLVKH